MNDGPVVIFTQAGVTSLPSQGRKREKWKSFILSFHYGNTYIKKNGFTLPHHISAPLSTWQLASGSFWAVETSLWTFGDVTMREEVQRVVLCMLLYACLHFHPAWLAFKASFWTPPRWKSVTVFMTGKQLWQTLHYSPPATYSALPAPHFFAPVQSLPPSFAP